MSDLSQPRSLHSPSVDSSDEVNYFDPGRLDSSDTEGVAGLGLGVRDIAGDEDAAGIYHPKAAELARSGTPDSRGNNQKYTQLGNYMGLSGPSSSGRQRGDVGSNGGSFISSLSAHSLDNPENGRKESIEELKPRASESSSIASEDESSENRDEEPAPPAHPQYSEEDKERMKLVFNQIFSSLMPNSSPHIGLGNGSDHGGSIARENIYYRERVKITTPLPAKDTKFKDKTRLVQTLKFHQGAIWAMKFSPCGTFLCTAGQDLNVVIWSVGPLPLDALEGQAAEGLATAANAKVGGAAVGAGAAADGPGQRKSFDGRKGGAHLDNADLKAFLNPQPYRVLEGHTGDVIDVAWSKSKFLLSASTDKTVCLWHVSRTECLQFFRHPDIVTAVEFHPAHDRYYISGCFDRKLRVWDIIPDGIVQEWTQTTDTITSICFSPDGKTVAGGLIQGKVYFYDLVDFDQLKYKTQMNCRNAGGKYAAGTKVTGMCYRPLNSAYLSELDGGGDQAGGGAYKWRRQQNNHRPASMQLAAQLLVSTNDSRLRLCRLDDYSLICKYRGLKNKSMQIKASFSQDGGHVICGSESGKAYIWETMPKKKDALAGLLGGKSNRNDGYECFDCTSGPEVATTVAIFAPVDALLTHLHHNVDVLASSGALSALPLAPGASMRAPGAVQVGGDPLGGSSGTTRPEAVRTSVDYSTRVVVTADYEGHLRVFFRLS